MTINTNVSSYQTYGAYAASDAMKRPAPDFAAMAQNLMGTIDTDGSGTIEAAEFTAMAESEGSSALTYSASLQEIFNALDSNGNGTVNTQELASAIQGMGPAVGGQVNGAPPPPPPSSGTAGGSEETSDSTGIYNPLDTNQDGTVSAAEYAAARVNVADQNTQQTASATNNLSADLFQRMLSYYGTQTSASSSLSITA